MLCVATSLYPAAIVQAPACTDAGTKGKEVSCTLLTLSDGSHYRLKFAAYGSGTLTLVDKPKQDAIWFTGKTKLVGDDLTLTGKTNDGKTPLSIEFSYRELIPGMPHRGANDNNLILKRGPNSFYGVAK